MKTGMEIPLVVLAFCLALVGLWSVWQGLQVEVAAAQVDLVSVGGAASSTVMVGSELIVKAFFGLLFGGLVTAGIGYGIAWLRRQVSAGKNWRGGPNARWKKFEQPPLERTPSEAQVYRAMLMQQYRSGGQARPDYKYQQEEDDEPVLRI
jgi:hypothetical protein